MAKATALPKAVLLPVARITPDPHQPRTYFDKEKLVELRDSIRQHGLKNPIFVRLDPEHSGEYILVAGERRLRCCQELSWEKIPAFVEYDETDSLVWQIVENTQRENLNPIEEARGYQRLKDERGFNQTQIAELMSKPQPHVSARLTLLKLPDDLQDLTARDQFGIAQGVTLVRRCKDQNQMRSAVHTLAERYGGASKISLAALKKYLDNEERRKELGDRKIDPDFVFEREFMASLAPVSARLLGLLSQLTGEEIMPTLSLHAFKQRWTQIPRVERTRFLSLLQAIAGRISVLNAFLRQLRDEERGKAPRV